MRSARRRSISCRIRRNASLSSFHLAIVSGAQRAPRPGPSICSEWPLFVRSKTRCGRIGRPTHSEFLCITARNPTRHLGNCGIPQRAFRYNPACGGNMYILWWIIVGLIAGWLTGKLMKGAGYGTLMDIVVGIIGAVVGGWIMRALGFAGEGGMIYTIIVAIIGAVVLTLIIRLVT